VSNRSKPITADGKVDRSSSFADISAAADILWTAYGEQALEQAKRLEARMPTSFFARKVREEIERRPVRTAAPGRFYREPH
jgi:hypothetical protein